jgi:hypothetical protein
MLLFLPIRDELVTVNAQIGTKVLRYSASQFLSHTLGAT